MRGAPAFFIVVSLAALGACSTAPSKHELPVLESYRSVESYGSLVLETAPEFAGSPSAMDFIEKAEHYARRRGIEISVAAPGVAYTSKISLRTGEAGAYEAGLYRDGTRLDRLTLADLSDSSAELVIDELLLLWHPPPLGRKPRSPVPEFALMPRSHEVSKESFFQLLKDNTEHMNIGHQAWYQLDSLTPTFSWEAFPRPWDLAPGVTKADFRNVRYEFRLRPASARGIGFHTASVGGEEAVGLTEPQYRLTEKLEFCAQYTWTVRAVFELNGVPRQTEWAGAYNLYPSMQEKPWFSRRGLRRGLAARFDPSSYFFTVRSPKNPFAEACVYR